MDQEMGGTSIPHPIPPLFESAPLLEVPKGIFWECVNFFRAAALNKAINALVAVHTCATQATTSYHL